MMKSRLLAVLLVVAMLLTVSAPALADNQSILDNARIFDEPVTITVSGKIQSSFAVDWNDVEEVKKIEEVFGIKFDALGYSGDAYQTQLTMMMTTDTLPDLLICASLGDDADAYGMDGYLLNLMDYIDYMPNLKAMFETQPDVKAKLTAVDGGVYSVGKVNLNKYSTDCCSTLWINNKWLDNLNLEMPTTADELLTVLRAFRDQDANGNGNPNDEIPLAAMDNWSGLYMRRIFMSMFGLNVKGMGKDDVGNFNFFVDENGKVNLAETTENYKAYLKFMRTLYEEKLLDPEYFVQTDAQLNEKLNTPGKCGVVSHTSHTEKGTNYDVSLLAGLTSDYNPIKTVPFEAYARKGFAAINANTKYPAELCRFLDFFLSAENVDAFYTGLSYDYQNVKIPGYEQYVEQSRVPLLEKWGVEQADSWKHLTSKIIIQNALHNILPVDATFYKDFSYEELEKLNEAMLTTEGITGNVAMNLCYSRDDLVYVSLYPTMAYTADESADRTRLMTDLCSYINAEFAQFVLGNKDIDANFDSFVATLNKMGLQELLKIEQTVYDRNNK